MMLPQESFVDRRIAVFEEIEEESEDDVEFETLDEPSEVKRGKQHSTSTDNDFVARQYVGELFTRIGDEK